MVFGINIGNTNVSAAVSQSNRVAVIANAGGEHRSRSVVAKGQEGDTAVGTAATNSRNTVLFTDILNNFATQGGKHVLNKQSGGLTQNIRVDSCLGALAADIAETCRDALAGSELAVLAVPDDWEADKVNEYREIVEHVTKFKVSRTLTQSSAAWLATKQNGNLNDLKAKDEGNGDATAKSVLVLRIGGTSASGTLLEDLNGLVTQKETFKSSCGADLVVRSIQDQLIKEANRKLRCDVSESKKSIQKVEKESRRAVEVMSNKDTVAVQIESLFEGMDFQAQINRGRIEMFTPYKQIVDPLADKFKNAAPDQVIVVGGGGKSPKIQSLIKSAFAESQVTIASNCEDLVSLGCAIQAHIISVSNEVSCSELPRRLPLSPISLTAKSEDGATESLIAKFAPLPVSFTYEAKGETSIDCSELGELAKWGGQISGSLTERGLTIRSNGGESLELLF